MKAITISQPYADLIARGEKFVENRTWQTMYRGPLAIHAGNGTQYMTRKELKGYTTGAIVATCELIACIDLTEPTRLDHKDLDKHGMTLDQVLNHTHCEGPVAWVLYEIRQVAEPIPVKGSQGLWDFETNDHESLAY